VEVGPLPLLAAVAVADAVVESLGPAAARCHVEIVWPNDVLVDGRKVAGILCELSADQERVAWAAVGIGINVRAAPPLADARWTPASLGEFAPPPARADLLVALLGALGRRYAGWLANGPAGLLAAYAERDALAGRSVTLALDDGPLEGTALGLDTQGRLRVRTAGGETALAAGEVVRLHH
jgi:BirA family biotin operon repressor/biotin-[acetyl-CoA-carboxylase] ligase